jgi:hypothetical protein
MRRGQLTMLALVAGLAAGGCGSDEEGEPIPQGVAADIEAQLENIQGQIDDGSLGACKDIKKPGNTFATLRAEVARVPDDVDADVRDALAESVDRLGELVDDECSSREPETETTPEETVPEETVPEETVPEETVPEETVPEETVPEENPEPQGPPEETPGEGGGTPGGGGGGSGGLPIPGKPEEGE